MPHHTTTDNGGHGAPHLPPPPPPPPPQPRMVDMFKPPSNDNCFQQVSRWGAELSANQRQQQHQQQQRRSNIFVGSRNTFQNRMHKPNPHAPIASKSFNSVVPTFPPPPQTLSISNLNLSSAEELHAGAASLQNSDQAAVGLFANARARPFVESSNQNTWSGRWQSASRTEHPQQQPHKHYV
jgi:hypothetical protein